MAEEIKCPHCSKSIDDVVNDEKTKLDNLKDLYKRYCECRDQELERFWKSSAFVWTFLGVCFAAYGILVTKFMDGKLHYKYVEQFPIFSSFICAFGILLSIIWYRMAKAEKVWYEVYEMAIWKIESFRNKFKVDRDLLVHNFWTSKEKKYGIFSPSKIVLSIGKLLIAFWFLALIVGLDFDFESIQNFDFESIQNFFSDISETMINIDDIPDFLQKALLPNIWKVILVIIGLVLVGFIIWLIIRWFFNNDSSELRTKSEQNVFNMIKDDKYIYDLGSYYEVKNGMVTFLLNDEIENENQKITEHFFDLDVFGKGTIVGKKVSYTMNDIEKHYSEQNSKKNQVKVESVHNMLKTNNIEIQDVNISDNDLYVFLDEKYFVSNAKTIVNTISNWKQKNNISKTKYVLNN